MKRVNTKVGDVFSVKINIKNKKYFQYIISDLTQLNSDVIRAFKETYSIDSNPELSEIVSGEVDFYAHCVTKLGVKMGLWERVGNTLLVGRTNNILFRDTGDYGNPEIKISQDWWIWRINEQQKHIGKLVGDNQTAEIGLVINPESIVYRMRTGEYDFNAYPSY